MRFSEKVTTEAKKQYYRRLAKIRKAKWAATHKL